MDNFLKDIANFSKDAGINILIKFAIGVAILIAGLIVTFVIKRVLRYVLKRSKRDEAMINFVVSFVDIILKILVLITALATMGINTASIIAVIGTCGVAIGLALKDSLGNLASGIMIILNKPFKKDDYIEVEGLSGKIVSINLFNTTLLTPDNRTIVLPNSHAVNNPIVNFDGCAVRRLDIEVKVMKGTDIDDVKSIVSDVVDSEPLVTKEIDYSIRMDAQTEDCVQLTLRCWVNSPDYWDAKYNLTENIYTSLNSSKMLQPNRQTDVYLKRRTAENEE